MVDDQMLCHASGNPEHRFIYGFFLYHVIIDADKKKGERPRVQFVMGCDLWYTIWVYVRLYLCILSGVSMYPFSVKSKSPKVQL